MNNNTENNSKEKIIVLIQYGKKDLKDIINGIVINYFSKIINDSHI